MINLSMVGSKGRLATTHLVVLATAFAALFAAACQSDSATGPSSRSDLRLEAASGTQVEGTVGEAVNEVPTVIVRNPSGRPVAGVRVSFAPLQETGDSLGRTNAITDFRGVASPGSWLLSRSAGHRELIATLQTSNFSRDRFSRCVGGEVWFIQQQSPGFAAEVPAEGAICFSAKAQPGPSVALSARTELDSALPGEKVSLLTSAVDRFGNFTEYVPATLSITSGGGSIVNGPTGFNTWTLGSGPGLNSVVASAPGLTSDTVRVQALDVGATTYYDLSSPQSYSLDFLWIALSEKGVFTLYTGWTFLGGETRRQSGTYTINGTKIMLTYPSGDQLTPQEGTLVGDTLSLGGTGQPWILLRRP